MKGLFGPIVICLFVLAVSTIVPSHFEMGRVSISRNRECNPILWKGKGVRRYETDVKFKGTFGKVPRISLGITSFEISKEHNFRYLTSAKNVRNNGFHAVIQTWGDTKICQAGIQWLAVA